MTISSARSPLWGVPYLRNPFFTGLEDTLGHLHQALKAENAVALSHLQGISGLGEIWKTQTALEYAYRYGAEYHAVLWVRADTTAVLISSFVELAHLLDVPERDEQDRSIIVEAVLRWLRCHTGWLLIFDGMDDFLVAEPFLPKAGSGHLLFPTRSYALGGIAQRLEVQKMEPEVGALLLLRRASILPLQGTLDMATIGDRSVASEISQEMYGLPLALDQAGAYVQETPCMLTDYQALYQARHRDIVFVLVGIVTDALDDKPADQGMAAHDLAEDRTFHVNRNRAAHWGPHILERMVGAYGGATRGHRLDVAC